jgi:hypothetical protein
MSKPTFADVMASEKNGRRRVTSRVCFSPDLDAEYRQLEAELEEAYAAEQDRKSSDKPDTTRRLAAEPRSVQIAKQMAQLVDDNADSFYELVFEQARRHDWLQLRTAHPPRDGNSNDGGMFNSETFGPASIRLCMVDPEPTDDTMKFFEENLSNGEWGRLTLTVWALNEGTRDAPKSQLASSILNGKDVG